MYSVLVFKTRALDLNDIETSKSLTSSQISQSSAFSFLDSRRCLWDVYSPTDAVEIEWKHFAVACSLLANQNFLEGRSAALVF